ncbi:hypothetical protein DR62_07980 [Burkholderia thailandensis]|nr:hypothetical protein DR62_07980 [Burkholderia thailandensis]AOI55803.1 hypothetical protein WI24_29355 [Burkholderia thailandensis]AOJ54770.1 hypothetical protein AQ475_29150 [Burkholderia thailandensis]
MAGTAGSARNGTRIGTRNGTRNGFAALSLADGNRAPRIRAWRASVTSVTYGARAVPGYAGRMSAARGSRRLQRLAPRNARRAGHGNTARRPRFRDRSA